jgi:hypothetical protein
MRDSLAKKNLEDLQKYALNIENYSNNGQEIYGGLHDYVDKLSKEDLIKYILTACLKKKELLEEKKFNSVVQPTLSAEEKPVERLGGLHDYIFKTPRNTLIQWAFTCEAHENKLTGRKIKGGLHDYIRNMSDYDIATYILKKADKFSELDSAEKLNAFAKTYSIQQEATPVLKVNKFGGLHDYIYRTPRETLIQWALTGEAHENKINGQKVLGGLHDYIGTLSNADLADYVLKKAEKFPELDSAQKLNAFAKTYSIQMDKPVLRLGGLHDYIYRTPRATLVQWAYTCEAHENKMKGEQVLGGLHDYIDTLTNDDLADYIVKKADQFEELNSNVKLDAAAKKFGIRKPEDKELKFLQA